MHVQYCWVRFVLCGILCLLKTMQCDVVKYRIMYGLEWRTVYKCAHERVIFVHTPFLIRHNESINDDKNEDLHTSIPCLTRSVYVLLVTWRHNRLLMTSPMHHGHIHGRSCKKCFYHTTAMWQSWKVFVPETKRLNALQKEMKFSIFKK